MGNRVETIGIGVELEDETQVLTKLAAILQGFTNMGDDITRMSSRVAAQSQQTATQATATISRNRRAAKEYSAEEIEAGKTNARSIAAVVKAQREVNEAVKQRRIDERSAAREREADNRRYLAQLKEINNETRKILSAKGLADYSKSVQGVQQPLPPGFIPQKAQVNDALLSTKIQAYFNQQVDSLTRKNAAALDKELAAKIQSHYDEQAKSIAGQNAQFRGDNLLVSKISAQQAALRQTTDIQNLKFFQEELKKGRTTIAQIEKEIASEDRHLLASLREYSASLQAASRNMRSGGGGYGVAGPPGGGGPGGAGGNASPLFRPPQQRSFAGLAGAITRNILFYELVSGATYGLEAYVAASIQAAKQADDTSIALRNAAEDAKQNIQSTVAFAEGLQYSLGISRRTAEQAYTESLRFAEQEGGRADDLLKSAADIRAAKGFGSVQLDDFVEQLRRGESKFYKRAIGKTVEELYQDAAKQAIGSQSDFIEQQSLTVGPLDKGVDDTYQQRLNRYVASLTQAQKERIQYNAIIQEGSKYEGEAVKRQGELAGQLERTAARWADLQLAIGEFVVSLRPVNQILTGTADTIERFTKGLSRAEQTAPVLSQADVYNRAAIQQNSGAARVERFLSTYGALLGVGSTAVGGFTFLGSRRANTIAQENTFQSVYSQAQSRGLRANEARFIAQAQAEEARAGMLLRLREGVSTFTQTLTTSLLDITKKGTEALKLESASTSIDNIRQRVNGELTRGEVVRDAYGIATRTRRVADEEANARAVTGARVGGLAGAGLGGILAYKLAQKLEVGEITAAVLTVAGSAGGDAIGTSVGSYVGARLAGQTLLTAVSGVLLGVTAAASAFALYTQGLKESAERELEFQTRLAREQPKYLEERKKAEQEGRLRFYVRPQFTDNPSLLNRFYTGEEARRLGLNPGILGEYIDTSPLPNTGREGADYVAAFQRENSERYLQERQQEDDKNYREGLRRAESALQKIRNFRKESLSLVGDIAGAIAPENPFVKIFSDGATAMERMRQQYGFLGEATVKYFADLENKKLALQYVNAQFESQATAMRNLAEAQKLQRQQGLGIGTYGQAVVSASQVAARIAVENPELEQQIAQLTTRNFRRSDYIVNEQLGNILSAARTTTFFAGGGEGLGQEAKDAIESVFDTAIIGLADKVGRENVFRDYRFNALRVETAGALQRQVGRNSREFQRQIERAKIAAEANADVDRNLVRIADLRRDLVGRGIDAETVTRAADRQILAVTGAVGAEDLSPRATQGRIDALKREAERQLRAEDEARKAAETAIAQRGEMLSILSSLRDALLAGDLGVLLKIQNDTEAYLDETALRDSGAGNRIRSLGRSSLGADSNRSYIPEDYDR